MYSFLYVSFKLICFVLIIKYWYQISKIFNKNYYIFSCMILTYIMISVKFDYKQTIEVLNVITNTLLKC